MKAWYRLQAWWRRTRNPPAVMIEYFGQRTPRPQVCVSIQSATGGMTLFADMYSEQSNAAATLFAWNLRDIGQMRVIDERGCDEFMASADVPGYCDTCHKEWVQHPEYLGRRGAAP